MADRVFADTYGTEPVDYEDLLDLIQARPAWHYDALCREHPNVDFFPSTVKAAEPAVAVCGRCLVRVECRAWAMGQEPGLDGVWGGLTVADRARLRREQRAA